MSGVTVALALTSLMLFPEDFLRSMGYGGVATVAVDVLAALTVLPALLAVLGHRVNALRIRRSVQRPPLEAAGQQGQDESSGAWYRLARSVMRRPLVYVTVITIALLALGAPFLRISWGGTDARTLPAASTVRQVSEALDSEFPLNSTAPIEALITGASASAGGRAALVSYLHRIDAIPGVTGAQVTGGGQGVRGDVGRRVDIGYTPATISPAARHIVTEIRALAPPAGTAVLVGGTTAGLVDELASLGSTLPWMALLVCLSTFVLLFLAFGSVILPLKAIVMNVLSLSATFGVIVWIFQWGHLSGLLRFTPTGSIDPTMPILMLAIIFGLSMDYEVFLLSRIRERYDQTGDNTVAVAAGLQRTGGVITSLALLLIIVVGAFSASGITFIKLMGVGMIVALLVDASVVRVLLVPATMRLIGRANWWAPRPLRRLYARYGIKEESPAPLPVPAARKADRTGLRVQCLSEEAEMNQPVAVPEVQSTDLPAGAFLLDVREDDEWAAGHAPDAVHVRLGELGARVAELPRDRVVYVICRSGTRSAYARPGADRRRPERGQRGRRHDRLGRRGPADDQRGRRRTPRRVAAPEWTSSPSGTSVSRRSSARTAGNATSPRRSSSPWRWQPTSGRPRGTMTWRMPSTTPRSRGPSPRSSGRAGSGSSRPPPSGSPNGCSPITRSPGSASRCASRSPTAATRRRSRSNAASRLGRKANKFGFIIVHPIISPLPLRRQMPGAVSVGSQGFATASWEA